jgi:hypothetical protein
MKKTFPASFVRAAIGSVALGLTLVGGIGDAVYAEELPGQETGPAPVTSASSSTDQGAQPLVIHVPYAPPSMGGSYIPSNNRGPHNA